MPVCIILHNLKSVVVTRLIVFGRMCIVCYQYFPLSGEFGEELCDAANDAIKLKASCATVLLMAIGRALGSGSLKVSCSLAGCRKSE